MNPRIPDPQASPPTCDQCGGDASYGYYDDWRERFYCSRRCFENWADGNYEELFDYYWRMNIG